MKRFSLTGNWQLAQLGEEKWFEVEVPGCVHTSLLALGLIPDPFIGDNEEKVAWVAESSWQYRKHFTISPELLKEDRIELRCYGLDTLAEIRLNAEKIAFTDNMFRSWTFEVKDILKEGGNDLSITFFSPVNYVAARQKELPLRSPNEGIAGAGHLRKAQYQFGWDWEPKLPTIGIWKRIELVACSHPIFTDVNVKTSLNADMNLGKVRINCRLSYLKHNDDLKLNIFIKTPTAEKIHHEYPVDSDLVNHELDIPSPELWWPNGFPIPELAKPKALYHIELYLKKGSEVLDHWQGKIGFRSLKLLQAPDQWGESFQFIVNGYPIFMKGANWVPADSFPCRITFQRLQDLVLKAAACNMNMLRIWGGGYYPEDELLDLCDEYGILVWQDLMFACSQYPCDNHFLANTLAEIREQVRRMRHHPSLALWCGNNELEQGWVDWGWDQPADPVNQALKAGYEKLFYHLIPELLAQEDPDHPYWPSSASSGKVFQRPNAQEKGDCHYWDVWHGRKPFAAFRSQYPRFMSEFGFQALPSLKTIAFFDHSLEHNLLSRIMDFHQRSWIGNGIILSQMSDHFRQGKHFADLVYLSQVLQAEGIRYGVEHWRRQRSRVAGTLYWQLNDCWPAISWSSIDYFGRLKALHYLARHFYAPVLLSVKEEGFRAEVNLTNDMLEAFTGELYFRLEATTGEVIASGDKKIFVPPLMNLPIMEFDFTDKLKGEAKYHHVLICELYQRGMFISRSLTAFVPYKHLELPRPDLELTQKIEEDKLILDITTPKLALFVEIESTELDLYLSDNYFHLPARTSITLKARLQSKLERDSLKINLRSLYDSYTS